MGFWEGRRVCVTGGAGFIGSYLTELLVYDGAQVTVADNLHSGSLERIAAVRDSIRFLEVDLTSREGADEATKGQEIVLNLAAKATGIEYNRSHQAETFSVNMQIASCVIDAAARNGVGRFLVVSSACVYPHDAPVPTPESAGTVGTPEPTNEGYGWAKRMAETLGRYYANEGALSVAVCRPFNAYGARDHWDAATSHVIPGLIRRVVGGEDPMVVYGTGTQTRSFVHVRDTATGMKLIAEKADTPDPVNIGVDKEISIRDLTERIIALSGRSPELTYDRSKPDGYARRCADPTRLLAVTGWLPETPLDDGLKEMIAEYESLQS